MSKTEIEQTKPIAPWVGGKRILAKRVCAIIDAHDHLTYAEPFIGMGGIFLRRKRRPRAEYINDKSQDVYNLFRILQEHYPQFLEVMRFQISTQANFKRLAKTDPNTLTDLQRAARFLYLQRLSFGGTVDHNSFGVSKERPARFNMTTLEPDLEALHERLAGVTVMCIDYHDFINRLDKETSFFYLDPPYFGCENYYGKGLFSRDDFAKIAAQLRKIKGTFLLSINDTPEMRACFEGFHIVPIEVLYTVSKSNKERPKFGELLIGNFKWEA